MRVGRRLVPRQQPHGRPHEERVAAVQALRGEPVPCERRQLVGQMDGLHGELKALGERDDLPGLQRHRGLRGAVHHEAAAQREELELCAAQADERVGLADPPVVQREGRGGRPPDEVAGDERGDAAVGQSEADEGEHGHPC